MKSTEQLSAFFANVAQTSLEPMGLVVTGARGCNIHTADGREYLDLLAGIGVAALGHGNEEVLAAIDIQARSHLHVMVYGEFVQEAQAALASRLAQLLPASLSNVYFTNSGGRVVGVDLDLALAGVDDPVVFDYWVGDDADASPVVDEDGMLYVAVEYERGNERSREVGQLVKLDPYSVGDPRLWGVEVLPDGVGDGGIWATPALGFGHVYVPTHTGRLLAVDADTGVVVWEDTVGFHAWSSAAVVDDSLVVATCETGELRRYSLADPASPELMWSIPAAPGCVESTPAIWNGTIYVGSRDGFVRAYR